MKDLLPHDAAIDLSNCAREPIHTPGHVQAHGALFVLEIAFIVTKTLQKKVGEKSEADAAILKVVLNYLQVVSFAAVIDFS